MNQQEIAFPEPVVICRRNYWRKGDIRRWRAALAGQEHLAPQSDDEVLISSRQVRDLFGGVSDMWLWRKRQRATGNPPSAA
jgi:hypothetical protein